MKQSSAIKAAKAQKKRDAKTEENRKLAEAIKNTLYSAGRKPEKGGARSGEGGNQTNQGAG